jgi:Uma2 family endonuclease
MEGAVIAAEILATEPLRLISVEEYDHLVDSGAFEDEHVELLEGVMVEMSPRGTRHSGVIAEVAEIFSEKLRGRAKIFVQAPFAAGGRSKPEPDVAVVPPGRYMDAHPSKAFLIVEVADTSLRKDRVLKPTIYAAAKVPEYWVIDVHACTVLRMTEPQGDAYARAETLTADNDVSLVAFPGVVVKLRDVLP